MIEKKLKQLATLQKKHPIPIVLIILTITLFLGYYALRVETDSSFDVLYNEDSDTLQLKKLVSNEFGSTDLLYILVSIDNEVNDLNRIQDIRHPDVLKAMVSLQKSLEAETHVYSTMSLAYGFLQSYGKLPETLEESKEMINNLPEEIKAGPLKGMLSKDLSNALIAVSINVERKPGALERIEDNTRQKVDQSPFPIGVKATLTGMPILINRIMWFLISDNMNTIGLAIIAVFIILWIYFRSYKIAFFSTIPVILTLTWLAGTLYLLDIKITMIIASVGAMMVGMSVDYAIHLTHSYHEKIKQGEENPVEKTVVGVGSALVASVATTIAGFLAMLLGSSPMALTQGKVLSIGILYAFITTFMVLPPLMILQRKFIYSKLDEVVFKIRGKTEDTKKSVMDIFLSKLALLQVKRPWFIIGIVVIATVILSGGFGLVYMDTEGENWLPEEDDVVDSLFSMDYHFTGLGSQNVLFMLDKESMYDSNSIKDLRDPRVLRPMGTLDNILKELKWVDDIDSPTMEIKAVNKGKVPHDFVTLKSIINKNPQIRNKFSKDFSITTYKVEFSILGRNEYDEMLREISSIPWPKEIKIVPQGGEAEMIELDESLLGDTMKTTLIGFILVIILAAIFYTSIVAGFLAFFPIIFAMMWTVGIMGFINLPFTVLTTGMLSMLMGMGIDFSIHIIHSIKHNIKEYGSIEKAIPEAMMGTGKAVAITTLTTVVGFMALSFAALVNTKRLGWTLGVGIMATFFACILIVPAILTIQYRIQQKNKNKRQRKNKTFASLKKYIFGGKIK
jgi:uncharacterized protein